MGGEDKKLIFNELRRRRKNIQLYLNIETAITHKLKTKTSQSAFNCSKLTRKMLKVNRVVLLTSLLILNIVLVFSIANFE